jgi:signal transduction histidine kinase
MRTLLREAWVLLAAPAGTAEARRPAIFALLFWLVLAAAVFAALLVPSEEWHRFGWPPIVAATVILIAIWQALPWDPTSSWRRKLLVPAFLVAALLFGYVTVFLWGLAFYPIAVANAVFVFGFRRAIAFAVLTLPVAWASVYASDPATIGVFGATFMTALVVPMAIFMVGICKVVIDEEQSRLAAQALLRDLETANAELTRQAERVKMLAIAEERSRIAREVHDSLGHHLTAINLQLQNAERFAERDPERSWQKVREARASTLLALAEVRRSVRALKPSALAEQNGVAALSALARSFAGAGPEVTFRVVGQERLLAEATELVLYRALQEGLTNAAKHATARKVAVELTFEPDVVRLTIADDGAGAPDGFLDGGFGLPALRERVEARGGTLLTGNRPEGGFRLEVSLPDDAEPERSAAWPSGR